MALPLVLAGPILRRVEPNLVSVWLALRDASDVKLALWENQIEASDAQDSNIWFRSPDPFPTLRIGDKLHLVVVTLRLPSGKTLIPERLYSYDVEITPHNQPSTETLQSLGLLANDPPNADPDGDSRHGREPAGWSDRKPLRRAGSYSLASDEAAGKQRASYRADGPALWTGRRHRNRSSTGRPCRTSTSNPRLRTELPSGSRIRPARFSVALHPRKGRRSGTVEALALPGRSSQTTGGRAAPRDDAARCHARYQSAPSSQLNLSDQGRGAVTIDRISQILSDELAASPDGNFVWNPEPPPGHWERARVGYREMLSTFRLAFLSGQFIESRQSPPNTPPGFRDAAIAQHHYLMTLFMPSPSSILERCSSQERLRRPR